MKATGVIDARVSLMREAHRIGELDQAIVTTLDNYVDNWRAEPHVGQWWESFDDLQEWIADNGRMPEPGDAGAAGLRPWLDKQDGHSLTSTQLHALLSLPQFPTALTSPLWSTICVLPSVGVVPSRGDDRLVIADLVSRCAPVVDSAAVDDLGASGPALLSYLMFVARVGRQPGANETSGRWIRAQRAASNLPAGVAAVLELVPDWRGAESMGELFAARHGRWVAAGERAGRTPRVRSENVEERVCAAWASRVRRAYRAGRLSAAEAAVVVSMG